MRKTLAIALAVIGSVILAGGCATAHKVNDEELIRSTVVKVKDALEKRDIDLLMATFSEKFQNDRVGGKAEAKSLLGQGLSSGYADGGKVSLEAMAITIAEDKTTAKVYPIDLSSNMGSVAAELVLTKEEGGWMVTNVNVDGV